MPMTLVSPMTSYALTYDAENRRIKALKAIRDFERNKGIEKAEVQSHIYQCLG